MTATELRVALATLDLPQKRLAELTGCWPETVSRWTGGQKAIPAYVETIIGLLIDKHGASDAAV